MDGFLLASDSNGKFQKNRILNVGRNDIVVSAGKEQVRVRVLRLAQFRDVEEGAYKEPIELLATLGTLQDDGDGQFNGKRPVTRAELADILVRIKNYQLPDSVAAVWENFDTVVNAGLMQGYPDGKYKTAHNLTNAQCAILLARLEFGTEFKNNVKRQHWADNAIDQLEDSGTYRRGDFIPYNAAVSKEKLALLLYKTKVVRTRVEHMLNFEDDSAATPVTIRNTPQAQTPHTKDMEDFQSLSEGSYVLSSPANGQTFKKPEAIFRGNVTDLKTLEVNGEAIYLRADGKFFQKFALKPGKNSFKIKSVDNKGGVKEETRLVVFDE
jgi:hypothetical protein